VTTPFVVAHRAGNHLPALADAVRLGVGVVEVDVHAYRGGVEVRHTKSMGPWPLLWERWHLADGMAPPLELGVVLGALAAMPAPPALMVDMKGLHPRLAVMVARAVRASGFRGRLLGCSRVWRHVTSLGDATQAVAVHSVGTPRELARLLSRFPEGGPRPLQGVSIHMRLLTPGVVAALRERTDLLMSWPVNDPADGRRLTGWGVTGLITDRPALVGPGGAARA
jgi:glycerophosphoryl diester phosphodiesterase